MVKLSLPHPIPITNPTSPFRNFNFMRPIKIVGSDTDLHDYQVRIHLDRSNFPLEKCKPDGSDIRFRDDSGEILPYWIERWNAAEGVIWCKIPFIPAESSKFIWMIYGNPNAKSESNGNAVFELFDVQGIVGFWHMDEPQWTGTTGEVKDETGVNHGTAYGGATTTSDGKYGRAGLFDGENDYINCGKDDSLNITDAITIETWINSNLLGEFRGIVFKGQAWMFREGAGDGTIQAYVYVDGGWRGITSIETYTPHVWSHVVMTYDSNTRELAVYVNGVSKSRTLSDLNSYTINPSGANTFIGTDTSYGDIYFNGIIDELRIYNRALSPTEIQILYKNYMQKMGSYFNVRKYVTPAPVVIV